MSKDWRLLSQGLKPASYNMALDEALLLEYARERIPTLRLYGWQSLSLSLGFSQEADTVVDCAACRARKVPVVRRITGGGVLAHKDEITYSIVCSREDLDVSRSPKESFRQLCSFLIGFYEKLSLTAGFSRQSPVEARPFCLSSCQEYDLLIQGKKIGGNAQRRKKDLILQHGTIPLSLKLDELEGLVRDDLTDLNERATSLGDLCARELPRAGLYQLLRRSFEESFNCRLIEAEAGHSEEMTATRLEREKYSSQTWSCKDEEAALAR